MLLHDERIEMGDSVFDVSLQRGSGRVTEIRATNTFDVTFRPGYSVTYHSNGVGVGESQRTLYWHDPGIFILPVKNEPFATQQRIHLQSFRASIIEALNTH